MFSLPIKKPGRRRAVIACAAVVAAGGAALACAVLARPYDVARLAPAAGSSLILLDRDGHSFRVVPLRDGGQGQWVSLAHVPRTLIAATLAGEDHRFADHPGVDGRAVLRAAGLAVRRGRVVSGASTVTMQLVRLIEPHPRTMGGKLGEMINALRLERAASKDVILEQYLNRACYGHGAFGVEAAARHYFGKSVSALSDGEASLLAIIPRSPRRYDPRTALAAARERRAHVLGLMVARGWLDEAGVERIEAEPLVVVGAGDGDGGADGAEPVAPHFSDWVLSQLPPAVRQRGGSVRTTLDLPLQRRLEAAVRAFVVDRRGAADMQAGLVVINPRDGSIRAMVGSTDHAGPNGGMINIATTRRHPGSALKPFFYALALEQGATPASLAHDTLAGVPAYHPRRRMPSHGVASFRDALAGSYNIAAIDVLDRVGVPAALERLRRAGLGPLEGTASDYGLELALGSPRVRLLDLAAAYSFLVNDGVVVRPRFLADQPDDPGVRVYSPEASWLTLDVLADAQARRRTFGADLPVDLPFPIAVKTGTSSGFADTVAVGATREAIVAVWAGAFDGSGTKGALAMWRAAPLVRSALLAVSDLRGEPLTLPPPPPGIVTRSVCRITGQLPRATCPIHREHFAGGSDPATDCPGHGSQAPKASVGS